MNMADEDTLSVIEELVAKNQRNEIVSFIATANFADLDSVASFGKILLSDDANRNCVGPAMANLPESGELWRAIIGEIYDFFCTNSVKYSKERIEGAVSLRNIVSLIGMAIAAQFNIAVALIAGAVTVAVYSVLKIGRNAWCLASK